MINQAQPCPGTLLAAVEALLEWPIISGVCSNGVYYHAAPHLVILSSLQPTQKARSPAIQVPLESFLII